MDRFPALIFTFSCRSFQALDIAGEPREADGAAARPGGLRQPGLRRPRVRAGGLSAEAVSEGLPTKNVLPGKLILFPHPSLTSTSPTPVLGHASLRQPGGGARPPVPGARPAHRVRCPGEATSMPVTAPPHVIQGVP